MSGRTGIPRRREDEKEEAREPAQSLRESFVSLFLGRRGQRPGSTFARQVLQQFKESAPVGDEETGPWFATVEAANWDEDDVDQGQVSLRFSISREPREPLQHINSGALTQPRTVTHDFRKDPPTQIGDSLTIFFTFTDELSLTQNIELFRDFTTLQLKDSQLTSSRGKR